MHTQFTDKRLQKEIDRIYKEDSERIFYILFTNQIFRSGLN